MSEPAPVVPADEPAPQTEDELEAEGLNVNGEVIDSPTVNAHVVGVEIIAPPEVPEG